MEASLLPTDFNSQAILAALVMGVVIFFYMFRGQNNNEEEEAVEEEKQQNGKKAVIQKKTKAYQKTLKRVAVPAFSHSLLHTTLKGHSSRVLGLDTSINGKYLASCSDDRTVRLWSVKDFGTGNKCVRANVEYDNAKQVRFSPDSRAFIAGLSIENTVRVFKLGKKDDGVTTTCTPIEGDFPKYASADLLNIGVGATSSGGSFVMTAYKDTTIQIRDLKGVVLSNINTNQGNNNCALVSPCGRFVASSGWTPDVKVWVVDFTRSGDFKEVARAFELKGHSSSVWSFAFNNDSTRMISVSKDGTWRFFDTRVEYDKGQEPYLLNSGELSVCGCSSTENECMVALSPDARVAAVGCLNNISVFSTDTGKVEVEFKEVHTELITALTFDIAGRYILSAGDRHIRVFHNTLGYKETIRELEAKLRKEPAASATRERLQKQVDDAKKCLQKIAKAAKEGQKT